MKKEGVASLTVSILVKKKGGMWIGHCLELDIVATSGNLDQLKKDMNDLIAAQVEYAFSTNNLDHLYHAAPKKVWEEFYKRQNQEQKIKITPKKGRTAKTFIPKSVTTKISTVEERSVA